MIKYYKVWLNEMFHTKKTNIFNENPIICKKTTFTENFYKESVFIEIITGKVIYPNTSELRKELTYEMLHSYHSYHPHCEEISATKVKEWLKKQSVQEFQEYIDNIYKLEQSARECYDEEQQYKRKIERQERIANKSVKRTLRKIKHGW